MRTSATLARLALLCTLGTAGSCKRQEPLTIPEPAEDTSATTDSPTLVDKSSLTVAPVDDPRELIPPDALAVFEGKSFTRGVEIFGRDRVAAELPEEYGFMSGSLTQVFGSDLMVPANLRAIGLDPDGPVGAVFLNAEQEAFALYATVADPVQFREAVTQIAARGNIRLRTMSMGGSEMMRNEHARITVIIRGKAAFVVHNDKPEEGHIDYGRAIATMDPAQGLRQTLPFKKAAMGFVDTDALVYLSPASMLESIIMADGRAYSHNWAAEELVEARKRNATAEEISRLEAQVAEVDKSNARWKKEREDGQELARMLFGDLATMVFRADVRRSGIMVEGRAMIGEDAYLRGLIKNGAGKSPLTSALNGKVLYAQSAQVEVEPVIDLIDRFARLEGASWKLIVAEIRKEIGVDLDADLRPILTGQGGFALTLDSIDKGVPATGISGLLGATAHGQVTDPAKLDAALAKLGKSFKVDDIEFKQAGDLWVANIADWRTAYLGRAGDQLVFSTDKSVFGRFETKTAGNITEMKPGGAYAAYSMEDQASSIAMDGGGTIGLFFLGMSSTFNAVQPDPVPMSRAYRRKKKELAKTRKKLNKLEAVQQTQQFKAWFDIVDPFGASIAVMQEVEHGFTFRGGQFFRGASIPDLIINTVKKAKDDPMRGPESPELDATRSKYFEQLEQLREIRRKDEEKLGGRTR